MFTIATTLAPNYMWKYVFVLPKITFGGPPGGGGGRDFSPRNYLFQCFHNIESIQSAPKKKLLFSPSLLITVSNIINPEFSVMYYIFN